MSEYLVEMENISKQFQGEYVLDSVDFRVRPGEIHGLLGENGAGKSVLMKILAGVYKPDRGSILIEGKRISPSEPKDSQKLGITTIYQDINLVAELSVAENIFFGQLPLKIGFPQIVDWTRTFQESEKILKDLNFNIDARAPVRNLNIGQKQMVEIAKALSRKSKVIIMDEPYTGLSDQELEGFFKVIKNLKSIGISIIYISHRMEDVLKLCDTVTILREGRVIENKSIEQIDKGNIIRLMIGKDLKDNYPKLHSKAGRTILRVDSISTDRGLKNVSFNLRKGEILGIAGLLGSGRTAIARAIYGLDKLLSGAIYLNETLLNINSPEQAIKSQIAYLTEDRLDCAIEKDFGIPANISLANLGAINNMGSIKLGVEKSVARDFIKKFVIKTPSVEQNIMKLSGGNQQKVLLARWLFTNSTILILDEPTKGIDKCTKVEMYNFMNKYILDGSSIIFISSDMQELMGMSDRILVLYSGEIRAELNRREFNKEDIFFYASGGAR